MFKYYELEQQSPDAAYNVARALHQVGLRNLAYDYYQKVLNAPDSVDDNDSDDGVSTRRSLFVDYTYMSCNRRKI